MEIFDLLKNPADTEIAWQWVKMLFPDAAGGTPFTRGLQLFSTALMLIATSVLSWHVLSGVVQTAYSGKVLGERWHQIWAPLRVILGFGLLVPMAGGGLSGSHMIVERVAAISINLADGVWSGFVSEIAKEGQPLNPVSAGGRKLAWQIVESEVCRAVLNAQPSMELGGVKVDPPSPSGTTSEKVVSWNYGTECGVIALTMPDSKTGFAEKRKEAVTAIINDVRDRSEIAKTYAKHYATGTPSGISDEASVEALKRLGALPAQVATWVRESGDAYDKAVRDAAAAEAASQNQEARQNLADYAKLKGWISAGMYWRSLSQISALTTAYTAEVPTRTEPRPEAWGPDGASVKNAMDALGAQMRGESANPQLAANDLAFAGDAQADVLTRTLAPLLRPIVEWSVSSKEREDPIGRMMSFGHVLIDGGEAAIAAGAGVAVAGKNLIGSSIGAGGAVDWLLGWAKLLIQIVFIVGAVHAYILPAIPFIFVGLLALGWLVAVLEATIASLIWAFLFVKMDGHELVEQAQRQGMMIIFNLMLRPVLGVLALCGAFYLVPLALNAINTLWGTAYAGQQGGNVAGVFGVLVGIVLLTFLEWHIVVRLFGLIIGLPDRIAHWFGAPTTGWGEAEGGHAMTAGAVAMAATAGRSVPMTGGKPKGPAPSPTSGQDAARKHG